MLRDIPELVNNYFKEKNINMESMLDNDSRQTIERQRKKNVPKQNSKKKSADPLLINMSNEEKNKLKRTKRFNKGNPAAAKSLASSLLGSSQDLMSN